LPTDSTAKVGDGLLVIGTSPSISGNVDNSASRRRRLLYRDPISYDDPTTPVLAATLHRRMRWNRTNLS